MSESPSDPVVRSDNTEESPTGGAPPRRRFSWAAILGWSLLLAVVAGGGLLLVTGRRMGKYEAEVVLQIRADPESLDPNYCRTQMALVRSRLVLMTALKDSKVAALPSVKGQVDPLEWMAGRLKVDFSQGPEFMRLSMRGDDEQELTVLLDAVVNAYLNEVVYKEHNKRLARIDRLKDIAQNHQNRIDIQKNALRELQRAAGAADRKPVHDINNQGVNLDRIQEQIQQAEQIAKNALADAAKLEVERAAPPRVQRLGDGVTIRKVK